MATERTSTSLVRFLGARLSSEFSRGAFANVFRSAQSQNTTVSPAIVRLTNDNLVPASINIDQFQAASATLQRRGISPLVADAMAVVFADVAKARGTSVLSVIDNVDSESLSLVKNEVYQVINQLRDSTSKLSNASATNNTNSVISRRLKPYGQV